MIESAARLRLGSGHVSPADRLCIGEDACLDSLMLGGLVYHLRTSSPSVADARADKSKSRRHTSEVMSCDRTVRKRLLIDDSVRRRSASVSFTLSKALAISRCSSRDAGSGIFTGIKSFLLSCGVGP